MSIPKSIIYYKKEKTELGPAITAQFTCLITMFVSEEYEKNLMVEKNEFWEYTKEILIKKLEYFIFGEIENDLREFEKTLKDLAVNTNPEGIMISHRAFQQLHKIYENLTFKEDK